MKQRGGGLYQDSSITFSALGRAVWDETRGRGALQKTRAPFSALGRAVWDETVIWEPAPGTGRLFQCSRSSRMG